MTAKRPDSLDLGETNMLRVRSLSLVAATLAAASTMAALAIGVRKTDSTLELDVILFVAILLVLGSAPYIVFATCAESVSRFVRLWAASGLILYGVGDFLLRAQTFFFSQSSTDSVALATYPLIGTAVMFPLAAGVASVWKRIQD